MTTPHIRDFRDQRVHMIGIGGSSMSGLASILLDKGYLYRSKKGKLRPYATYVDSGLFEMKEFVNDKTGYTDTQTMITPKGKETFRLLCI